MIHNFKIFLVSFFLLTSFSSIGQFEYGYTLGFDFYQRFRNPSDDIASRTAGNAVLNVFAGPKIWIGGEDFSVSFEGQVNLGLTSLSLKDYKGIGSVSFPVLAKLNFAGASGMDREFEWAYSIGGGMEWVKTELLYLTEKYEDLGVERKLFPNYIIELGLGRGGFGMDGNIYVRYGFNTDPKSSCFHIGLNFNILKSFEIIPTKKKKRKKT